MDPIARIKATVRDIPDFPKPGILFKDITPLLADPEVFASILALLAERLRAHRVDALVGIESRGFVFGAALAAQMGLPFQLARKPGKLPYDKVGVDYELEYGSDRIEMHADAIERGRRYAIIDDLIATGGTAGATAELVIQQGGTVACYAFVIELSFLEGRAKLGAAPVEALVTY